MKSMASRSISAAMFVLRRRRSFSFSYPLIERCYNISTNSIVQRPPLPFVSRTLFHSFSKPEYVWHPAKQAFSQPNNSQKPSVAAVLVGWVGSEQRHMREFAEWYTSRGIHAITVSVPPTDLLSYYLGRRAQQDTELLVQALDQWLNEDVENRNLIFHTLCAGWLVYSFILDTIFKHHRHIAGRIKGCIIDSSPLATPDPQIWAKGFSIAILKKRSSYIATDTSVAKPSVIEPVIVSILDKIFSIFFNLPRTKRRFNYGLDLLSKGQPPYPQLYLYSSGDRVLPDQIVKDFIEEQRRDGRKVNSYDFIWSPHVGHLRCQPDLYTNQLTSFLNNCLPSVPHA
eukprot:Gb_08301 [translate_table: standard]